MAKELFIVMFDVAASYPGFDNAPEVKKSTTGKSLGPGTQEPVTGLRGQVFSAKVCEVEAESAEEAILVAQKAYGSGAQTGGRGGGTGAAKGVYGLGTAHAAKKGEWKSI